MVTSPSRSSAVKTAITPPALWDPVVRLAHWSIALTVLVNAVLTRGGSGLHVWAGWAGMSVLALRLLWGLIGPSEARFSAFPPNPAAALRHLADLARGKPRHYISHNPAGALMAYALWGLLAVVIVSGLVMTGARTPMAVSAEQAAVAAGDWSVLVKTGESGDDASDTDAGWKDAAEEMHEIAANLILALVLLHVAGVAVESRAMRRNLLAPMLAGRGGARRK